MKAFLLFLFLVIGSTASAQAIYPWAHQLSSSTANAHAKAVATDWAGNSYVTGSFSGVLQLGSIALSSRGTTDLYVAKYNATGKVLWARQIGRAPGASLSPQTDARGTGISVDVRGNVYVIGGFNGTVSYGTDATTSSFSDYFTTALLAKYNSRGQIQWVERFGIPQYGCYANAIANDLAGNSYVTGQSDYGGIRFGNQVVGGSRRVMFVARYTTTGAVSWAKVSSNFTTYGAAGVAVALDGRGSCVVGGFFNTEMTLEGTSLASPSSDMYLANFNAATGNLRWLKQGNGTGEKNLKGLALDLQGNVYVAGGYSGTATLGEKALPEAEGGSGFLARYTRNGVLQWVQPVAPSDSYRLGLTVDLAGTSTLFSVNSPSGGPQQTILHTFLADGSSYATETTPTTGSCVVSAIAGGGLGNSFVLVGDLSGTASFGSAVLNAPSGTAGFIVNRRVRPPQLSCANNSRPTTEIYPNPVRGRLVAQLSWPNAGMLLAGQATLRTFLGTVVATQPLVKASATQAQATFDCGALPTGFYVLHLSTADGATQTKAVEIR